jgi:hypothetical protein
VSSTKIGPVVMEHGRVITNHIPGAMGLGRVDTAPGLAVTALGLAVTALGLVDMGPGQVVTAPGPAVTGLGLEETRLGPVVTALGRVVTAPGRADMAPGQVLTVTLNSLKDSSTGKQVMAPGLGRIHGLVTGSNLTDKYYPACYPLKG